MDSAQREALAERVLAMSNADQTEVSIGTEDADLTRFTHEEIHQNVARSDAGVSVRAILGLRTGTASTNLTRRRLAARHRRPRHRDRDTRSRRSRSRAVTFGRADNDAEGRVRQSHGRCVAAAARRHGRRHL